MQQIINEEVVDQGASEFLVQHYLMDKDEDNIDLYRIKTTGISTESFTAHFTWFYF